MFKKRNKKKKKTTNKVAETVQNVPLTSLAVITKGIQRKRKRGLRSKAPEIVKEFTTEELAKVAFSPPPIPPPPQQVQQPQKKHKKIHKKRASKKSKQTHSITVPSKRSIPSSSSSSIPSQIKTQTHSQSISPPPSPPLVSSSRRNKHRSLPTPVTFSLHELSERIASRSKQLQEDENSSKREISTYTVHQQQNAIKQEELKKSLAVASDRHNFFAKLRVFLVDVTACLSEKRPMILDLLTAQRKVRKETTELLVTQHQHDLKDTVRTIQEFIVQNGASNMQVECVQANSSNQTNPILPWPSLLASNTKSDTNLVVDEFGRSAASANSSTRVQTLRKEARSIRWNHRASCHPWNALNADSLARSKKREKVVLDASKILFNDVRQDLRGTKELRQIFHKWSIDFRSDFEMTFGALCMPEIFEWYARVSLLRWNPLASSLNQTAASILEWPPYEEMKEKNNEKEGTTNIANNTKTEKIQWSRTENLVLSSLMKSCAAPHVQWHVEHAWDPGCPEQTESLINVISILKQHFDILASDNDWISDSVAVYNKLINGVIARLTLSITKIQMPLIRKTMVPSSSSSSSLLSSSLNSIDEMEQNCIQHYFIRIIKIGLSVLHCSNIMSESICRTLLFHQLGNIIRSTLQTESSCINHLAGVKKVVESYSELFQEENNQAILKKQFFDIFNNKLK